MRQIEGRNPVYEAIQAGTRLQEVYIKRGTQKGKIYKVLEAVREKNISISEVDISHLDQISQTGNHQGVIAVAADYHYYHLEELLSSARQEENPLFLILDHIQDPHNLGSILRTADAAGVTGVIFPERRAAQPSPLVNRIAAGAMEHLCLIRVKNIARTIELLKKELIWICGAESTAEKTCYEAQLARPLALVIGNEGYGLSRLVGERCDFHVTLPMLGKLESLNAGVAAAILLYEAVRQRYY